MWNLKNHGNVGNGNSIFDENSFGSILIWIFNRVSVRIRHRSAVWNIYEPYLVRSWNKSRRWIRKIEFTSFAGYTYTCLNIWSKCHGRCSLSISTDARRLFVWFRSWWIYVLRNCLRTDAFANNTVEFYIHLCDLNRFVTLR